MAATQRTIMTDRQLVWWITHLRRKWKQEDQYIWQLSLNVPHWAALWLSIGMVKSLRGRDGRQISRKYHARIISGYADLPMRLEVKKLDE